MATGDNLLTPPDVAALLGVTTGTLAKWRLAGRGPAFVRLGRAVRYREADVTAYLDRLPTHYSTSDYTVRRPAGEHAGLAAAV